MKKVIIFACAVVALAGLATALSQAAKEPDKDIPSNVVEILKKNCTGCHVGQRPPKGLSLIASKIAAAFDAPSAEKPALKLIDTANPESSYLLKKILGASDITGSRMPRGKHMAEADIEALKAWILSLKK
jgi:mono/diheme cytochrome c family protein